MTPRLATRRSPFRRPDDMVEGTRWLFGVCALISLALAYVGAVPGAPAVSVLLLTVSALALAASWLHRYRTRRSHQALDLLDVVALTAFALGCPVPAVAFGATFSALWFRAVYGRTRDIWFYATGQCLALVAALVWWQSLPGHDTPAPAGPVLGALPLVFLLAVVARHLALGLFARERAQARDAALVRLGTRLLGLTDEAEVAARGWAAAEEVCAATPGLVILALEDDGTALRLVDAAGGLGNGLPPLPRTFVTEIAGTDEWHPVTPPPELMTATSAQTWLRLPTPDHEDRFLLVGARGPLPRETLVAVRALTNQMALALQICAVHRELRNQAETDALTGLANRAAFTAALAEVSASGAEDAWVLFADLDGFKEVNDEHGHAAGDAVLRTVGARLAAAVRAPDLCARLGGDEFALLIRADDGTAAQHLGQRLVAVVAEPVWVAGHPLAVQASAGVARVLPGRPWDEALQHADLAMYTAKSTRSGQVLLDGAPVTGQPAEVTSS
ncbi:MULTISPECIES: diguanylate cyclase domain-containing protein [unclassified Modestobacter]